MSDEAEARAAAVGLLARREHSQRELWSKLTRKGLPEAAVATALAGLNAERLQSDERFAEVFVRSRIERGQGPVRIAGELREHGFEGAAVEAALAAVEVDWRALAAEVRQKRFGRGRPEGRSEWARQARFLQYRGFASDVIRQILQSDECD